METLLIRPQDIAKAIELVGIDTLMDKTIAGLTEAFKEVNRGQGELRTRAGFVKKPSCACVEWMPYMRKTDQSVTVKVVAYQPDNIQTIGIPTVLATTSLYDFNNGHLVALCDAVTLTAIRTGAASAIASKILANPDSATVGLVGAGAQAVTQLHGLSRVFPLQEVLVYDINPDIARSFSSRVAFLGLSIRSCSLDELERNADIICTATSVDEGADPVITGENLKPHVHINAVGADIIGKTELPLSLLKRSFVCPDFPEQALLEGECQQLQPEEVRPSLMEMIERPEEFYHWREQQTVFDSTGLAIEDHVALSIMQELVQAHGLGQRLQLEYYPNDPYNPYEFITSSLQHPPAARQEALAIVD
ncbi:ornithine cyclodeaminase family protein [Dapis sp. BLCC M229]|uniref:ornithine cyclodeaminase family protein n=1 Tax=Dapis sp. BLCC M229 TaxID=3400188 RepID=UPI003CF3BE55